MWRMWSNVGVYQLHRTACYWTVDIGLYGFYYGSSNLHGQTFYQLSQIAEIATETIIELTMPAGILVNTFLTKLTKISQ